MISIFKKMNSLFRIFTSFFPTLILQNSNTYFITFGKNWKPKRLYVLIGKMNIIFENLKNISTRHLKTKRNKIIRKNNLKILFLMFILEDYGSKTSLTTLKQLLRYFYNWTHLTLHLFPCRKLFIRCVFVKYINFKTTMFSAGCEDGYISLHNCIHKCFKCL